MLKISPAGSSRIGSGFSKAIPVGPGHHRDSIPAAKSDPQPVKHLDKILGWVYSPHKRHVPAARVASLSFAINRGWLTQQWPLSLRAAQFVPADQALPGCQQPVLLSYPRGVEGWSTHSLFRHSSACFSSSLFFFSVPLATLVWCAGSFYVPPSHSWRLAFIALLKNPNCSLCFFC